MALDKGASLEIGIDDSTQLGKGLGSEAVALVLGLHSMFSSCIESPSGHWITVCGPSARIRCGFVVEGREREAAFVDGIWHDWVIMAILDREYAENSAQQGALVCKQPDVIDKTEDEARAVVDRLSQKLQRSRRVSRRRRTASDSG